MAKARKAAKAAVRKAASGRKSRPVATTKKIVRKAATKAVGKTVAKVGLKAIARSIPGVGTVMGLIEGVQDVTAAAAEACLPAMGGFAPRRKASKGITGTELKGFRRVSALLRKEGLKPKRVFQAPAKRR